MIVDTRGTSPDTFEWKATSARNSVTRIARRVPTVDCVAPRAKVQKAMTTIVKRRIILSAYDVPLDEEEGGVPVCVCV